MAALAIQEKSTNWLIDLRKLPLLSLRHASLGRIYLPQFILDTDHPWILHHRHKLERLARLDPSLTFLSNPYAINVVSVAELEVPSDIFEYLEVDNVQKPGRYAWPSACRLLREMRGYPEILRRVKAFHVDILFKGDKGIGSWTESIYNPKMPNQEILKLFADVLEVDDYFTQRSLHLPSVRALELGAFSEYLIEAAPNVERIWSHDGWSWMDGQLLDGTVSREARLIRAAGRATHLQEFRVRLAQDQIWSADWASLIVERIPQIRRLELRGGLWAREHDWNGNTELSYPRATGAVFKEVARVLGQHRRLRYVGFPFISELDMGWDGGAWSCRAFLGNLSQELRVCEGMNMAAAVERAAAVLLDEWPTLEGFDFGGVAPTAVSRDSEGKLIWPWTGREEAWSSTWTLDGLPNDFLQM